MNLKKIALCALSLTVLASESIKADYYGGKNGTLKKKIEYATFGLQAGYITGLVPVIGQCALFFGFPFIFDAPGSRDEFALITTSVIVGHIAGIATFGGACVAVKELLK